MYTSRRPKTAAPSFSGDSLLTSQRQGLICNVSPDRVLRILTGIVVALLCMNLLIHGYSFLFPDLQFKGLGRLRQTFNVDMEKNIPSMFSFMLLVFASLLLAVIARFERSHGKSGLVPYWWVLCVVFAYIGFDELAEFHEVLGASLSDRFQLTGFLLYAWVIPFGIVLVVMFIIFSNFLFYKLPPRTSRKCIIAGIMYVGGALVIEMIGGWHFTRFGNNGFSWILLTTVEEGLEMGGLVYFIHALLEYLQLTVGAFTVVIREGKIGSTASRSSLMEQTGRS